MLTRLRRYVARLRSQEIRLCPFHVEQTPSLIVAGDTYHCLGCGRTGPVSELP
jgi:DNA primase